MRINEIENDLPKSKPVKEKMSVFIDDINKNIPNRNGFIYTLIGAPGTGKSSLLLSLFRDKMYYKKKFENVFLITPESSFLSVDKHPFENHNRVYHDLSEELIEGIYLELLENKKLCLEEKRPLQHSCVIIDDFASDLKDIEIIRCLKKVLTKSRHIGCSFIFTLQAYNLFPLVLRKMITNITLFKPKNAVELETVRRELLGLKKDECHDLMKYIYDTPYNHLSVDTANGALRKNFNLLEIEY